MDSVERISKYQGDIPGYRFDQSIEATQIGWDIETTGLNWRDDVIGTCQIWIPDGTVIIIEKIDRKPENLIKLLENGDVQKIFHHAPFDLRFMTNAWDAQPENIGCTKVLAKILHPGRESTYYSLKPSLERELGVKISKHQQTSDWTATHLELAQLLYAATDVEYLLPLYRTLMTQLREAGRDAIAMKALDFLPTQVALERIGIENVFDY